MQKLILLSDLHFGKKLKNYDLSEEIDHSLSQVYDYIDENEIDAVIVAGDVFDKSIPSHEAIKSFEKFTTEINIKRSIRLYIIAGNHDDIRRLAQRSDYLEKADIFISSDKDLKGRVLGLDKGDVKLDICMIPYLSPQRAMEVFNQECEDFEDAFRLQLSHCEKLIRNDSIIIPVCHVYARGGLVSESELFLGESGQIHPSIFEKYDFSVLGHLHRAHFALRDKAYYPGTPYFYSFSELNYKKSFGVLTIKAKNDISLEKVEFKHKRLLRELKGSWQDLLSEAKESMSEDYIKLVVNDDVPVDSPVKEMKKYYKNLVEISRARDYFTKNSVPSISEIEKNSKTDFELISEYYELTTEEALSDVQRSFVDDCLKKEGV